jgi:ABC-type Zn uptake system ZnuABC Zn-binding protein ZnuA
MARVRRRVLAACAATVALGVAATACSDSAASPDPSGNAAARAVAAFTCPARATDAGASRLGPAGHKLQVDTTVAPLTSIVANVAGDRADVHGVIPEGTDSHTYEPKPSVAALFSRADVVFVNGLSLEDPTRELAAQNLRSGGQVIELGSAILRRDQYIYDFSFPRGGGKPNPHLWTSPPMARCYALTVASVLAKADPSNAGYYQANADKLAAKIDALDALFKAASDAMPRRHRALLTYHDAYAYFAAHYGWRVIGAIQVSSFEDPTPKEVARLIKQVRSEKVPAIFGSEVFPSPVLGQIGREAHVKYVDTLRDDDLPGGRADANHSYLGLMKADFVTIISSLGGDAGPLSRFDASDVIKDSAEYPQ